MSKTTANNSLLPTICFISDTFLLDETMPINGTQVQCYMLAQELADRGYTVHYISQTKKTFIQSTEVIDCIKVHWVPRLENLIYQRKTYKHYLDFLYQIQPDIIYNRGRSYLTYLSGRYASKSGAKFIWASNGENGCEKSKFLPKLCKSNKSLIKKMVLTPNALYLDNYLRQGINLADVIINQTEYQKIDLKKNFKITGHIIKSAHPVPEFKNKQANPRIVLWLASLSPGKQPEKFLSLAKHFTNKKDWEFWLVGGSNNDAYHKIIEEAAKSISNLKILGSVPFEESNSFFQKASIFVNTSKWENEGLPNTFVQAWLHGTPVVSLNINPDDALTLHQTGLFANGSLEEMQDSLIKLMNNQCMQEQMSMNARQYAQDNFDLKKIVDQYEALFKRSYK